MLQYPDRRSFLYANTWMRDSVHQFLRPRRSNILTTEAYQAIKRQRIRAARVEPSRIAGRRPPSSARRSCLNRERYRKENVREAEGGRSWWGLSILIAPDRLPMPLCPCIRSSHQFVGRDPGRISSWSGKLDQPISASKLRRRPLSSEGEMPATKTTRQQATRPVDRTVRVSLFHQKCQLGRWCGPP